MIKELKETISLVFTEDKTERKIYLKFDHNFFNQKPSYVVYNGSTGYGYDNIQEALNEIEKKCKDCKFTGLKVSSQTTLEINRA